MFTKNTYLVREHVAMLKLADTYDIIEADTGKLVAVAREKPGTLIHVLRFLVNKKLLPTKVHIAASADAEPALSIERGPVLFRSKVSVRSGDGTEIGYFRSKMFSLGHGFFVHNAAGAQVAEIKGDWKGWNFKFLDSNGREIGTVTKKWAGLAKEFFTSADNYVIALAEGQPQEAMQLLIAAGIAIDTVFKEA